MWTFPICTGNTSLHLVVAYNRFDMVVYLVNHFPRLVTIRNIDDEYPVEMIGDKFNNENENQYHDWFDKTRHKILWWLLRNQLHTLDAIKRNGRAGTLAS